MDFLITIDDERGKSLLTFLRKLDFVKLRPFKNKTREKAVAPVPTGTPAYFGACPDWDVEADELRKMASPQRTW